VSILLLFVRRGPLGALLAAYLRPSYGDRAQMRATTLESS
jgi:hypothetical protein